MTELSLNSILQNQNRNLVKQKFHTQERDLSQGLRCLFYITKGQTTAATIFGTQLTKTGNYLSVLFLIRGKGKRMDNKDCR